MQDPLSAGEAPDASTPSAASAGLLRHLNPEQLAAVTLPGKPALILAGAGSGKTRVLTTRIAWLLQTGQVSPAGVLAVTFTNKAAKEMLTRLSAMLPVNVRGMWIGTFHGLWIAFCGPIGSWPVCRRAFRSWTPKTRSLQSSGSSRQ